MLEAACQADSSAKRPWKWVKRIGTCAAIVYSAWIAALWFMQGSLIFPAYVVSRGALLAKVPSDAEPVAAAIPNGKEAIGWLLQPTSFIVGNPKTGKVPLAIWFHGNAEIIDQLWSSPEVRHLQGFGFAVLLVEYPGYGRAQGAPSQESLVASGKALYDTVTQRPDIDTSKVVFAGRSLGGGVACALTAERQPGALILLCTFTSVASFAGEYFVPQRLVRHPFRSDAVLATLDVPVLVMHGDQDTIIPIQHGRALAKAAKRGKFIVQAGAGHFDCPRDMESYRRDVEAFLNDAGLLPR